MPGEKLLQEFLPPSQLRHALSELLHALFQISPPRCSSFEQAVFQAVEPATIPPPTHPEYECARQRGTECPEKKELIHGNRAWLGNLEPFGLGVYEFRVFSPLSG